MFRLSNNLIGILNLLTFLLSLPIVGGGIWLATKGSNDCEKFLQGPVIAVGVFLMVVSLAGLIGACCRVSWLLWTYLFVMFILIVLLFCFTVFAFVVTNKGAGEVVSGRGYKEYRLGDYSNWLQKRVNDEKNWDKIRSCLRDSKVCQRLQEKNQTLYQFINGTLSPVQARDEINFRSCMEFLHLNIDLLCLIQWFRRSIWLLYLRSVCSAIRSGCCKPPTECGFTYQSETVWIKYSNSTSNNSDCNTWDNNSSVLCYNCQSCKAGVLANIKDDWKKVAIINIIVLIFLVIVYSVGCCAFRNNRRDNAYGGWK